MRHFRRARRLILGLFLACAGCFTVFQSGSVERTKRLDLQLPRVVESPLKAFYTDGSTAVFPEGARITSDSIIGRGHLYALGLVDSRPVDALSLDSLVGIEAFQGETHVGASMLGSLGATALGTVATAALLVAIFGSCPTFYTSPEQGAELVAEGFSYSIAPLLEGRDLDAIYARPDADGVIRLELRNEALETHYINHLDLVAVDHRPGITVVPDDRGLPVGTGDRVKPLSAADRSGRSVLGALSRRDVAAFASDDGRIASATTDDPDDWIDLTFPRPPGGSDEAFVVFRLRNSLLTTVLFYDLMLGQAGVGALDWIGRDMARIGTVVELGRWFQESMGLKVEVRDGDGWRTVARVTDTGPIAWEDVAVRVPTGDEETVRVRVRFLTDAWRIDEVALAEVVGLDGWSRVGVSSIVDDGEPLDPDILARLESPDDDYLTTYPGTSVDLEFRPTAPEPGLERSYLLATQGYYTEWVRPEWIHGTDAGRLFEPGEGVVEELMQLWASKKDDFEARFYASKVPVR